MTKEEMEMVKLVRESDVIDRTDCSELAKAFNYLFDKYVEAAVELDGNSGKLGYWIIERDPNTGKDMSYHCSECYDTTGHFVTSADNYCPQCGAKMHLKPIEEWELERSHN